MFLARTSAAISLWLPIALLSACSEFEAVAPPPLATAISPLAAPPPPALPQRNTPPPPQQTRAEIISWLSAAGYRQFQVAAFVRLADIESGFRACAAGPGGYRYLFQWGGTRLRQLREFANTSDCPQLRTQLAFTDKELRNEPKFSCFWGTTTEPAAYEALRRIFGRGSC
jgi:hypothetical protein